MSDVLKKCSTRWMRSAQKKVALVRSQIQPERRLKHRVIVASNGRAGSTLTYSALMEGLNKTDPRPVKRARFVPRLAHAEHSAPCLFKTHDFPAALGAWPEATRAVFCFGNTQDSALSVYSAKSRYGDEWVTEHFEHLQATGSFDELFERDVLQQARQVKEWAIFEQVPVLCVHYDALWDHEETVSDFTGIAFKAPPRRARVAKDIPSDLRQAAERLYGPIDALINQLPKCFVAGPQYKGLVSKLPS